MAIPRTQSALIGRCMYHIDEAEQSPLTVVDVVFDERVGRWEALLQSEDSGHLVQVPATKLSSSRRRGAK